jgi:hypothetical protein
MLPSQKITQCCIVKLLILKIIQNTEIIEVYEMQTSGVKPDGTDSILATGLQKVKFHCYFNIRFIVLS